MVDNIIPHQAMQRVPDTTRARLIAYGNAVLLVSMIPMAILLLSYYRAHAPVLVIYFGIQLLVTFAWFFLGYHVGADIDSIVPRTLASQPAATQAMKDIPHWTLQTGVLLNYLVVAVGVYLTGGIVNSPLSPYVLTMTLLGQYLAVNVSTKVLLVVLAVIIYTALVFLGGEGPILGSKAYEVGDGNPRIAFLITTVVNLGISFWVHHRTDTKMREAIGRAAS